MTTKKSLTTDFYATTRDNMSMSEQLATNALKAKRTRK